MLTENDVIEAIAAHLLANGYAVSQKLTTVQQGIDLIASRPGAARRLLIEAKGGTSSKDITKRFGKPFTGNQARSHISGALYTAAKLMGQHPDDEIALAFPDDSIHPPRLDAIRVALHTLHIRVFFVKKDFSIREMAY